METCPKCGAKLATPLGCGSCGVLFSPEASATPFELLGLPVAFAIDPKELKRRLLAISRIVHPDYFGASDTRARELAERNTAALNHAHELLSDPYSRADWIVRSLGGPSESEQRAMPRSFLMEVLEWNETLEQARDAAPGSRERAAAAELGETLRAQRESVLAQLARWLGPLPARGAPALAEARTQLNALRYLDTTLTQLAALEVDHATRRA